MPKRVRALVIDGVVAYVPLGECGLFATIDSCFAKEVGQYNWALNGKTKKHRYAARRLGRFRLLHRLIWWLAHGTVPVWLDHKNRNKLDCRLSNIRVVGTVENARNQSLRSDNTSGFKGVNKIPRCVTRPWCAKIGVVRGKQLYLGTFKTAEEAAHAYDKAAKDFFGAFAVLNFPEDV